MQQVYTMNKLSDVLEFKTDTDKELKTCKKCKNKSLKIEFLGKSKDGNAIFECRCLLGCTDFLYMITKDKKYLRTGNLNV